MVKHFIVSFAVVGMGALAFAALYLFQNSYRVEYVSASNTVQQAHVSLQSGSGLFLNANGIAY